MASYVTCPRPKRAGAELSKMRSHRYTLRVGSRIVATVLAQDAMEAHRKARPFVERELPHTRLFGGPSRTNGYLDKDGVLVAKLSGYGVSDGRAATTAKMARVARTNARIAKYGK